MTQSRREEEIRRKIQSISPTSHGVFWIFGAPQHTQKKPRLALLVHLAFNGRPTTDIASLSERRHTGSFSLAVSTSRDSQSTFDSNSKRILHFSTFSFKFSFM
jgi:hypothetical protein